MMKILVEKLDTLFMEKPLRTMFMVTVFGVSLAFFFGLQLTDQIQEKRAECEEAGGTFIHHKGLRGDCLDVKRIPLGDE